MGHIWIGRRRDVLRFGLFLTLVAALSLVVRALFGTFLTAAPAAVGATVGPPLLSGIAVPAVAAVRSGGFFADFRLERDRGRSAQQEVIRAVLAGQSLDAATRQDSTQRYLWIARAIAQENEAEGLIRGLGFSDALVLLSEGSANVIVRAASLDRTQVAQIADIVGRTTGVTAGYITIRARPD